MSFYCGSARTGRLIEKADFQAAIKAAVDEVSRTNFPVYIYVDNPFRGAGECLGRIVHNGKYTRGICFEGTSPDSDICIWEEE